MRTATVGCASGARSEAGVRGEKSAAAAAVWVSVSQRAGQHRSEHASQRETHTRSPATASLPPHPTRAHYPPPPRARACATGQRRCYATRARVCRREGRGGEPGGGGGMQARLQRAPLRAPPLLNTHGSPPSDPRRITGALRAAPTVAPSRPPAAWPSPLPPGTPPPAGWRHHHRRRLPVQGQCEGGRRDTATALTKQRRRRRRRLWLRPPRTHDPGPAHALHPCAHAPACRPYCCARRPWRYAEAGCVDRAGVRGGEGEERRGEERRGEGGVCPLCRSCNAHSVATGTGGSNAHAARVSVVYVPSLRELGAAAAARPRALPCADAQF